MARWMFMCMKCLRILRICKHCMHMKIVIKVDRSWVYWYRSIMSWYRAVTNILTLRINLKSGSINFSKTSIRLVLQSWMNASLDGIAPALTIHSACREQYNVFLVTLFSRSELNHKSDNGWGIYGSPQRLTFAYQELSSSLTHKPVNKTLGS